MNVWHPTSWEWLPQGRMLIKLECAGRPTQWRIEYVEHHAEDRWDKRGPINGLVNGNLENPTLGGSLLFEDANGCALWHGWLRNGKFVAA